MTGQEIIGPAGGLMRDGPEDPLEPGWSALVREWPDLREAAASCRTVLSILRETGPIAEPIGLTEDQAREKLSRGEPVLRGCALRFDPEACRELLLRLARGLSGAGLSGMLPIRRALEEDRLIPAELLGRAAEGNYASVAARANEQELSPAVLWTLARTALKPALRTWRGELAPFVRNADAWEKSICYLCGVPASLGELQGNEGARHLRCGQCGGDWRVHRLRCIHCGNEDPGTLGIFYPEERRDKVRVEVCDKCKGYLKVVIRFAPASPDELALEDLSTLYLDLYAQGQGYLRPQAHPDSL